MDLSGSEEKEAFAKSTNRLKSYITKKDTGQRTPYTNSLNRQGRANFPGNLKPFACTERSKVKHENRQRIIEPYFITIHLLSINELFLSY